MKTLIVALLMFTAPCWAAPRSFIVVVSGIGGEAVYSERFKHWAMTMLDAAESRLGIPRERAIYLAENEEGVSERIDGRSLKTELSKVLSRVATASEVGDTVLVLLIGHGSARRDEALFNLPGPDLTARELDAMLEELAERRLVIVNGAPSSAPFIKALSRPDRVVITATASASERYHTLFIDHFVAAFADDGADTDKNTRVSMLEAFEYARREVQRRYKAEGRLQSEHALLDDNGDGEASLEVDRAAADGALARTVYLDTISPLAVGADAAGALAELLAERAAIEQRIEALKAQKQQFETAVYEDRLEALLVELALTHRAIRAAGRSP